MAIKARFWVQKVTKHAVSKGNVTRTVELAPVVRPAPLDDGQGNVDWSKYTPSGSIILTITADAAGQQFEDSIGKDVAITFDIID